MTAPRSAPTVRAMADRLEDEMAPAVLVGVEDKPSGAGWQDGGGFRDYVIVRSVAGGAADALLGRPYADARHAVHTYAVAATAANAATRRDEVREALTAVRLEVDGVPVVSVELAPMGVDREDAPQPTVWSGVDRWLIWTA